MQVTIIYEDTITERSVTILNPSQEFLEKLYEAEDIVMSQIEVSINKKEYIENDK